MKELYGDCKDCLGCNKLYINGFNGTKNCKNKCKGEKECQENLKK